MATYLTLDERFNTFVMSLFLLLFFCVFQTIFRISGACVKSVLKGGRRLSFGLWPSLKCLIFSGSMADFIWTISADFICFSTLTDAVRILLLFEISKCSSSVLWITVSVRTPRWNVYCARILLCSSFVFLLFFSSFTCVAVVVYLLESQAGTDWRLGCVLQKINGSHIFHSMSFLKMPILQPATRAHTLTARFFHRLFGCYCCLSLTHFNMLRNAFTIIIRHTRKVALQTTNEKERR